MTCGIERDRQSYSQRLELELEEHTALLRDKTEELETLMEELRQQNQELRISELRYAIAVEQSGAAIYDHILEGDVILFPPAITKRFNLPARIEDASHSPALRAMIHPGSIDRFLTMYRGVLSGAPLNRVVVAAIDCNAREVLLDISITTIYDEDGKPIRAVGLLQDVTERSNLTKEKQYGEALTANRHLLFEANLTRDTVEADPRLAQELGALSLTSYSALAEALVRCRIHPDDQRQAADFFAMRTIADAMARGETQHSIQYRAADGGRWTQTDITIIRDDVMGELRIRCYSGDISEQKRQQLELLYRAERDQLTGLYNKLKTQQMIDSYLAGEGKGGKHGFFIFDLDHFKEVNDTMGHAFGDVVLSRTAGKASELFREDDILGRVGGDEFVVFMKNTSSQRAAQIKAQEICSHLREIYTHNGKQFAVSVSVGGALYPRHGEDYQTLFANADIALYTAKEDGRNQAAIYRGSLSPLPSRVAAMDVSELLEARSFERNVSEYIFRILYETPDKNAAINSVLELAGKQYGISRTYIFEEDPQGLSISNTYEWCNTGVPSYREMLLELSYIELEDYPSNFNELGIFYLPDIPEASPKLREMLGVQNIRSMLQFAIQRNGRFSGFVGFDFCGQRVEPTKSELTTLKTVANMLGVFLTEMRAMDMSDKMRNLALSIVDALSSFAYIIDRQSYALRFINQKTRSVVPFSGIGDPCYQAFWGLDTPCARCPMNGLSSAADSKCTMDVDNSFLSKRVRATASWIDWIDNSRACLMDCIDLDF